MGSVIDTYVNTQKEIEEILDKLKFRNGDLLRDDELKGLTKETVVYWFNKPEITDTKRAVIISIVDNVPNNIGLADNQVAFREMYAFINVLTSKKNTDPKLMTILKKIENGFVTKGWKFSMNRAADYDSSSERTTWSFLVSKLI